MYRLGRDVFIGNDHCTLGVDFTIFTAKVRNEEVKIQMWDTAGMERFGRFSAAYLRRAKVILLCADSAAKRGSLKAWRDRCLSFYPADSPANEVPQFVVVLTKKDLGISAELKQEASEMGLPIAIVSSRDGSGFEELKKLIGERAWFGSAVCVMRQQAIQHALACLRDMYRLNRACFAGVRLPRDVVEHCIVPALAATLDDKAWDRICVLEDHEVPAAKAASGGTPKWLIAGGAAIVAAIAWTTARILGR